MSLMVGQLIYTTLPNSGFQLLVSQRIPIHIQDSFVHNIVYQHWNVYNPPSDDHQAVYLHQVSATHLLFGWLYNEGRMNSVAPTFPIFWPITGRAIWMMLV